jgi:hypothetical protein
MIVETLLNPTETGGRSRDINLAVAQLTPSLCGPTL